MNKDKEFSAVNFTGLTHDHNSSFRRLGSSERLAASLGTHPQDLCSAISILKRHPMYDCLILVKKYRNCLDGYSLEFPVDLVQEHERISTNESPAGRLAGQATPSPSPPPPPPPPPAPATANTSACGRQRLVSRFLDGDDPMYQVSCCSKSDTESSLTSSLNGLEDNQENQEEAGGARSGAPAQPQSSPELPFMLQLDDRGERCELVHVPVNGLLDRLESYTRSGIAIDSRVYAFAMGLKTAERMITTKSMKEKQETPI